MKARALVASSLLALSTLLASPASADGFPPCGPEVTRHAWAEAIGVDGTVRWTTPLPLVHDGGQDNQAPVTTATAGYFAQEGACFGH